MATFESLAAIPTKRSDQTDEEFAAQMHALGYRQIARWVPDATRPGFAEECRRRSIALGQSGTEKKYMDELELPDVEGWH